MMTNKATPEPAHLTIGPRVAADIIHRIRELEAHWPGARSIADWAELARLREFLQSTEGDHV